MSEVPQVLLTHHLKALKLPTFLREYDKLARQGAAEGIDHTRYLLRLSELELLDRERRLSSGACRGGRPLPAVKSLDSLRLCRLSGREQDAGSGLARCEYIERGRT